MDQTTATPHRADNIPLAVGTIVFTVFALSLGDALIKQSSSAFVIWQIFVIRSLIALPFLVACLAIKSPASFRIDGTVGWTILRSLLLVAMWVCYYLSLPQLTLSVAAATYYISPIFITLFTALISRTAIGAEGWGAVILGFIGVVFILRPDVGSFNTYAILPLLAAMLYAAAMVLTRTKCRAANPIFLSLALNGCFVVVGAIAASLIATLPGDLRDGFLLAPWAAIDFSAFLTMAVLAASILIGSIGAAIAYQNGPSPMIGTFDFAYVGFSVFWGLVFFAEVPDAMSLIGMAMIVGAGMMSLRQ